MIPKKVGMLILIEVIILYKNFKIWCNIFNIIKKVDKLGLIWLSILGLIQSSSILLQLISIQYFINTCQMFSNKIINIKDVIISLIFVGIILIGRRLFNVYFNYKINIYINFIKNITNLQYIEKVSEINLETFYDANFETLKNKAKKGAISASLFLVIGLVVLSFNLSYFVFISVYYSFISPYMLLIIFFIMLPTFWAISKNINQYAQLENKLSVNRKKLTYFYRCIGDIEYLKETKVLGCKDYFVNNIKATEDEYLHNSFKHLKLILKNSLSSEFVKYCAYMFIFLLLIVLTNKHIITIGIFAATLSTLNDMFSVFNDMVDRDFKSLSSFYSEVENYINFLNMNIKESNKNIEINSDIKFNNISYKYPNRADFALNNINITIPKNKTIAIVGENGAGKSTFSKILLGLLTPTNGEFIINNTSITDEYSINNTSALFQNFCKYPFSLIDNISISECNKGINKENIEEILSYCGINYKNNKTFPNELNTILSREFSGIDLSGGQWQKIALARCIYRNHNFLILDEPTSAIDPLNEAELFSAFKKISENKTCVIITHRLGIVAIADYIIVLENGNVLENGTHEELIKLNGKYKKMYLAQSSTYF